MGGGRTEAEVLQQEALAASAHACFYRSDGGGGGQKPLI